MSRLAVHRREKIRLRRNLNWRVWELLRRGMRRWKGRVIAPGPQPGFSPCGEHETGKP